MPAGTCLLNENAENLEKSRGYKGSSCFISPRNYNEKENILKLLKKIRSKFNCLIIIVDDSKDKDIENIIKKNRLKRIKYFNRKKKLGRGSAVIFGLKKLIN